MKNEESTAGRGDWGWSEGAPGQYRPPNLILTQSLHLKYTCGKRAVSNASSLYSLFYSGIYNSVVKAIFANMHKTRQGLKFGLVVGRGVINQITSDLVWIVRR